MRPPAGLLLALAAVAVAEDYTVRFDVQLEGEKELSSFKLTVREKKAPLAARRFLSLVREGFFDGCPFFRVLPGYLVQFGLPLEEKEMGPAVQMPVPFSILVLPLEIYSLALLKNPLQNTR